MIDIASFESLRNGNQLVSRALSTIEESRENLISLYEKHTKPNNDNKESANISCPLCGHLKKNFQALLDEYNNQTILFEEQLGENDKSLHDITKRIIGNLVSPLVAKMKRFITHYKKYLNYDFDELINIKFVNETDFNKMLQVKKWLNSNIENSSSYHDKSLYVVSQNYQELYDNLIKLIMSYNKPLRTELPKEYLSLSQDLKALELSFSEDGELDVDSDDLYKDILFLNKLLIQKSSTAYQEKEKEIRTLERQVDKLSIKRSEIAIISNIYKDEIKAYEKDIAKHIAIPLFIYSSKILQSRPEGSGIFLITPNSDNAKGFMQFSATPYDSHDAWNTMSSGQLSGLVISFMLAMNKVYPSKLATLMIDDPVQTMDEINMASFVQMMKYEFPEVQILLSTHESKVANYFNYKYKEAGLRALPINMKSKRLELQQRPVL